MEESRGPIVNTDIDTGSVATRPTEHAQTERRSRTRRLKLN